MDVPPDLFMEWFPHPPASDSELDSAEKELGYKLPEAYRSVLKMQNGGMLQRNYFSSATNHFWLSAFLGVGPNAWASQMVPVTQKQMNLNRELIKSWSYPEGVVICHQGHAGYILDYSECGPNGEPRVLYALSEYLPRVEITEVASSFAELLAGLSDVEPKGTLWPNENEPEENSPGSSITSSP